MKNENQAGDSLEKLITDIKTFIRLSLDSEEKSIQHWIDEVSEPVKSFCYEKMACKERGCLAYKSACGRCWLQAGTMCGGEVQGKFADKYELCTECQVYKEFVGDDPVRNLRELVFTLVNSLNIKKQELKEALEGVKTLRGLIPIF